ncbi:MAG: PilZ domain-containing protein [Treponema sp.]|jgi:hypothetical protein|nr:PilZ domain-containing protein [Treponema sp.]
MNCAINMYLLQPNLGDFRLPNQGTGYLIFFLAGVGAVIVLLLILNYLKNSNTVEALNKTTVGDHEQRKFSIFTFRRIAANLDLDKEQTNMLEFVLKCDNVTDLVRSFESPMLLDKHFKKAFRIIERTSISHDEMNNRLSVLFATRNIIENKANSVTTTSTREIPENTAAVLAVGNVNYPIRVISSKGDSLIVENPLSATGEPLDLPKGSLASLSFFPEPNKGFAVDSRVLGTTESVDGHHLLQLVHSGQIKKLSKRRFRRRQTVITTAFYFVQVEEGKSKKTAGMTIDKRRFSGNIIDISIGGCSIKTSVPVNSGQKLKIEFTREDDSIVAALGEVLRSSRVGIDTIMNIKFLKVPSRSLNSINAMVYEYTDK